MKPLSLRLAILAAGLALTAAPALAQRPSPGHSSGESAVPRGSGASGGTSSGGSPTASGAGSASPGSVSSPSSSSPSSGAALFPSSGGGSAPREYAPQHRGGGAAASSPRGGRETAAPRSGGAAESVSGSGSRAPNRGMERSSDPNAGREVPTWARPRGDNPVNDTAVPRTTPRPPVHGGGYYPYYPGYCDPYSGCYNYGYGYGYPYTLGFGFGLGWPMMYDPYFGGGYGGYDYGSGYTQRYSSADQGNLKLKIKPRNAKVYVDGYFVGNVDDMDGVFQKLELNAGRHHVEVRAEGYQSEEFDVMITPHETTTFQGALKKIL